LEVNLSMAKSTGEPRVWKIPEGSGGDPLFDALSARPGTAVIESAAMGRHGDIPFDPHQPVSIHEQDGGTRPPLLNGGRTIRGASVVTRVKRTKKVVAKKTTAAKKTTRTRKPIEPEIIEEVYEDGEEMREPTVQVSFSSSFGTIRDFYHDVMIQNSWLILIRDADYKGSSYQPPAPTDGNPPPILDIQVTDGDGPDIFTGKVVSLGISFELDGYGLIVTVLGVM
jgi:hypothetical protein